MRYVKFTTCLIVFMFVGVATSSAFTKAQVKSEFQKAGELYKQGDYKQAISVYEGIVNFGWESGPIYYNLANSYAKMDARGKAILNYERALRLTPRDSDLQFNYQYIKSKVAAAQEEQSLLEKIFKAHNTFYSVNEMVVVMVIIFTIIASIYILSLYFKWQRRIRNIPIVMLSVLFIIFSIGLSLKIQSEQDVAVALVSAKSLYEPVEGSTTHFKLFEGSKIKIVREDGDWVKIQRGDGKLGWVKKAELERINENF